ncbi:MAG: DUF6491 family protein [Rhizomicrobium sp.]
MRALLLALLGLAIGSAPAAAQSGPAPQRSCFLITEMRGWKAPDDKTIYIRVNLHKIYRLDLAAACPLLTMPESHLITKTRGPDLVCSAIDWDLAVAQPPPAGMPEPCIVKQMTRLTPEQAAAIPPKFKP